MREYVCKVKKLKILKGGKFLMKDITSIILAAGEGKRMKSKKSKVIHAICGKPLVKWVCDQAREAGIDEQIIVVGHLANQVMDTLGESYKYVQQKEQLGTGHAVMQSFEHLEGR
jgi:bifunctional UDP-N-acetylglucosamine pyrophosphorylase/glucosamine-1-phosphate N-acetyltransferase